MWYVYILECGNNTLYTGATNDIDRRLKTHNSGKGSKYVRAFGEAKVIWSQSFRMKKSAFKREAQIKKLSRQQKLNLILSK